MVRDAFAGRTAIAFSKARIYALALWAFILLASMAVPNIALAMPIEDIDVGDTYFINNIFSKNSLVIVRRVDRKRNRVKVQFETGGTEWVDPSKLIGRTEAQKKDVQEAVVGTAVVLGAIWAILDPKGFKEATKSKPSTGGSSPIRISAIPFSPVVKGAWKAGSKKWKDWAEKTLRKKLKKSVSIESVRTKRIPFYSTAKRNVVLAEAAQTGRRGAYYLVAETGGTTVILLDGKGPSIHLANKHYGFSVDSADKAKAYLEFHNSAISSDSSIFMILRPDAEFLSSRTRKQIGISPIRVLRANRDWKIYADVLYKDVVAAMEFVVSRSGVVRAVKDTFKKKVSYQYRVVMDGPRRVYVAQ